VSKLSHIEVQNVFLKDGVDGIAEVISSATASAHTLRRALRELRESPGSLGEERIGELEKLLEGLGFLTQPLTKPDVGDVRGYRPQREGGRKIVKVPVDYLELADDEVMRISFDVNGFKGVRANGEDDGEV